MEPREVHIGDTTVTITRFKGLKAIMAGAIVSRVMETMPQIQDKVNEFIIKYRKDNFVEITPAMAKLPRFAALALQPEDFQEGTIRLPDEPTGNQVMVAMVPHLFDLARKEVMRFLALIVIPNSELEEADDADNIDEALDRIGKKLLRQGDIDEILEIAVIGWEVLEEQILSKQNKLGKLKNLPFVRGLLSTATEEQEEQEEETSVEETDQTLQTSLDDVPISSTSSDPDTTGTEEPLSTVSPGMS